MWYLHRVNAADRSNPHRGTTGALAQALGLLGVLCIAAILLMGAHLIHHYLGGTVVDPRERHVLRVLTWNIGKLYLPWESRASDRDLSHVAAVIQELRPNVVALQELRGPEQLGRLVTLLGPRWVAKVPKDAYDRRAGLLTQLPAAFVDLPTASGRTAQAARLVLTTRVVISVASLHLDAFDEQRRQQQAEEMLATLLVKCIEMQRSH